MVYVREGVEGDVTVVKHLLWLGLLMTVDHRALGRVGRVAVASRKCCTHNINKGQ